MSFISTIQTEDQDDDDYLEVLDVERAKLAAELATYRGQLLGGFVSPSAKARCAAVCLRLQQIDMLLNDEEE